MLADKFSRPFTQTYTHTYLSKCYLSAPSTHPPVLIHRHIHPSTITHSPAHPANLPSTAFLLRLSKCVVECNVGSAGTGHQPSSRRGCPLWFSKGISAQPTLPTLLGVTFSDPRLTLCPQHVLMESHCPSPLSPHMPAGWDCQLLHVRGSIALVQVSPVRRHCPLESPELQWPHVADPTCAWRFCSLLRPDAGPRSPSKLPAGSGGLHLMEDWYSGPSLGGPSSDWVRAITPRSSL